MGWPAPPILVEDCHALFRGDRGACPGPCCWRSLDLRVSRPRSGGVDQDDLGIVDRRDPQDRLFSDCRAVACVEPNAVDLNETLSRHQIAMPGLAQRVL